MYCWFFLLNISTAQRNNQIKKVLYHSIVDNDNNCDVILEDQAYGGTKTTYFTKRRTFCPASDQNLDFLSHNVHLQKILFSLSAQL